MANPIRPTGLSPAKTALGAAWTSKANTYFIPSTDTSAYYVGDLVKSVATSDAQGVPGVQKVTTADTAAARGVIVGVLQVPNNGPVSLVGTTLSLESYSIPATKTKGYYVLVDDDPFTIFTIQADGGTPLTATATNKNANVTVVAPTSPTQVSATVLATASVATTSTLQLKIMGLVPRADNDFGVNATYFVKINNHELGNATAGV